MVGVEMIVVEIEAYCSVAVDDDNYAAVDDNYFVQIVVVAAVVVVQAVSLLFVDNYFAHFV